jgi:hypothetical protein
MPKSILKATISPREMNNFMQEYKEDIKEEKRRSASKSNKIRTII